MSYFVPKSTPYGKVKSAEDGAKNVNTVGQKAQPSILGAFEGVRFGRVLFYLAGK